jgi:MFS family permease
MTTAAPPGQTSTTPARLQRDRMTWSLYAVFVVTGWFLYVVNPSIVLVADDLGFTAALAGLHGTAGAAGATVGALALPTISARIGRRATLLAGAASISAGVALITLSSAAWGTLSGVLAGGVGVALMLNIANAALSDRHGRQGGAALSEASATGSFISAAGPLVLGAAVAAGLGWRSPLLMVVVALALLAIALPALPPEPATSEPGPVTRRLPSPYWWAWAVAVPLIGVELSYAIWSSTLIVEQTGASIPSATSALTAFVLAVGAGRLLAARIALRVSTATLLMSSIVVAAVGWGMLWSAHTYPQAVAGMIISGLGVSVHGPIGIARALANAAGRTDLAMGRFGVGIGVAAGTAPFALGALTDRIGVVSAFWVVPAILGSSALLLILSWRNGDQLGSPTRTRVDSPPGDRSSRHGSGIT